MRHFYVRALVHKDDNHPWKNAVTFDKDGYARIPVGCIAVELNDDIIINGPKKAYNMSFALVSPEDNFNYNTARDIARGRLRAHQGKCIDGDNFLSAIASKTAHRIFKDAGITHKYLKYVHPELFSISARACLTKVQLDETDRQREAEKQIPR